jgi:hypothetical protein
VDQVSVVLPPRVTVLGLGVMVTVGAAAAAAVTLTVTELLALPLGPVQVRMKVSVGVANVTWVELPLVGSLSIQLPEAAQEVALVEDQVSVVLAPRATVVGEALMVTVGAAGVAAVTVTAAMPLPVPPGPVQVKV